MGLLLAHLRVYRMGDIIIIELNFYYKKVEIRNEYNKKYVFGDFAVRYE